MTHTGEPRKCCILGSLCSRCKPFLRFLRALCTTSNGHCNPYSIHWYSLPGTNRFSYVCSIRVISCCFQFALVYPSVKRCRGWVADGTSPDNHCSHKFLSLNFMSFL